MSRNILVIGGTGAIGSALAHVAGGRGYQNYSVGLDASISTNPSESRKTYICDRTIRREFRHLLSRLTHIVGHWDAVLDVVPHTFEDASVLDEELSRHTDRFVVVSSALVYDRECLISGEKIGPEARLAKVGQYSTYVDGKLRVEQYWREQSGSAWTIVRPYHILGRYYLLGCIPPHNRDPSLPAIIQTGGSVRLLNNGSNYLSFINSIDLAEFLVRILDAPELVSKAVNAVHPKKFIARDYLQILSRLLGVSLQIEPYWERRDPAKNTWDLTALNHEYDCEMLIQATGFLPRIGLEDSLLTALQYPAK